MKTLVTLFTILISALTLAQENKGVSLTIVFDNLTSDEGKVSAVLYDEATFMNGAPLNAAEGTSENKELTLTIENVAPGEYGVITLHDLNGNGRMDFEASGMPKEPFGTSNNIMTMGPPNFEDAKFTVGSEDITIHIRM